MHILHILHHKTLLRDVILIEQNTKVVIKVGVNSLLAGPEFVEEVGGPAPEASEGVAGQRGGQ